MAEPEPFLFSQQCLNDACPTARTLSAASCTILQTLGVGQCPGRASVPEYGEHATVCSLGGEIKERFVVTYPEAPEVNVVYVAQGIADRNINAADLPQPGQPPEVIQHIFGSLACILDRRRSPGRQQ